jgi:hypothetical protein
MDLNGLMLLVVEEDSSETDDGHDVVYFCYLIWLDGYSGVWKMPMMNGSMV